MTSRPIRLLRLAAFLIVAVIPLLMAARVAACAFQPEGEAANVRAIPGTCGVATFGIDAQQRRPGALRLVVGGSLYVRAIRLKYASSNGGVQQQSDVPLHRLLLAGETTDAIPTTRGGLSLVSVAVDVNPPGYGVDPVALALVGPDGTEQAAANAEVANGPTNGWMLIGSLAAHLAEAGDTIVIGRDKGRFDAIVVGGRHADLPVQSVTISPASGVPYSVDVRGVIAPGTNGRVIAIDPPDFLHQVTVTYGTQLPSSRVPVVELRAHYAENWLGRVGDNRQYAGGWVLLGTADIIASPHQPTKRDQWRVAGLEGPFKKLRFVARRGAVSLASAVVETGDGRQETVPVNSLLMPDTLPAPITLASGAVPIDSVVLNPQLRANSRIDATVEVWAQY